MDSEFVNNGVLAVRNEYTQAKIKENNKDRSLEIYQKDFTEPVYEGYAIHGESEPLLDKLNDAVSDIAVDMLSLEEEFSASAGRYSEMINSMLIKLDGIEEIVQMQQDKIQDINIICGNYPQFTTVKTLTAQDFYGTGGQTSGGAFTCQQDNYTNTKVTIMSVQGNGYEGNTYVDKAEYLGSRKALIDADYSTSWEYSRYYAPENKKASFQINTDNEDVQCTITMKFEDKVNGIRLCSNEDIIVEDVLSGGDDGIAYVRTMPSPIHINRTDLKYSDPNYVYNTGAIAFTPSKYVKLLLRGSEKVKNETIVDTPKNDSDPVPVGDDVYRKRISVTEIIPDTSSYSESTMETYNLISSPVRAVAIYANEYIPPYFDSKTQYIKYMLTVNGKDYEMTPINSQRKGTKIIRFATTVDGDESAQNISESIKKVSLKVTMTPSKEGTTPFLSDIKLCLGKQVLSL